MRGIQSSVPLENAGTEIKKYSQTARQIVQLIISSSDGIRSDNEKVAIIKVQLI